MLSQLVSSHGMLAILEVLEGNCSREVNMKLLHIDAGITPQSVSRQLSVKDQQLTVVA